MDVSFKHETRHMKQKIKIQPDRMAASNTIIYSKTMRLTNALAYTLLVAGYPKRGQSAVSPATSNCVDQNFTDKILYEPDGGEVQDMSISASSCLLMTTGIIYTSS